MIPKQDETIIVGLDIGSTKVCAVAGRLINNKDHARLDILGVGKAVSEGVNKGSVFNIDKTARAINQAVEEAAGQANVDVHVVNVGFSSPHIAARRQHGSITRTSPGDEVTSGDVAHLVSDMYRTSLPPGSEIIHVLPMDFSVDNETGIDDPVGRIGVKLEADFQVITAQTSSAVNTRKCVTRAQAASARNESLEQDKLLLSPLASAMAVLTEEEKQAGVVLVDIGGGTTDVAIYHKGVLRHITVLPFSGKSITADIEIGCKILPQQAELLKTKFGSADPTDFKINEVVAVPGLTGRAPKDVLLKNVAIIIEARLKEIAAMVQSEVIRSGYKDKLFGGVVLSGGTASIHGIERIFERVTGMDVRIGFPDQLEHNVKADLVSDPAFATAVGLVWAGFKSLDDRVVIEPSTVPPPRPVEQLVYTPAAVKQKEKEPAKEVEKPREKESKEGGSFWSKLVKGTKSFFNDDINYNDQY